MSRLRRKRYDKTPAEFLEERKRFPELTAALVPRLQALGWIVDQDADVLAVRGYFKNGKPNPGHRVRLQFTPHQFDEDGVDPATGELPWSPNEWSCPWRVKSNRIRPGIWCQDLEDAIALFLEQVSLTDPHRY